MAGACAPKHAQSCGGREPRPLPPKPRPQKSAGKAISELASKVASTATDVRAAAMGGARAAAERAGGSIRVAPEPSSLPGVAARMARVAAGLASLYFLDAALKAALSAVRASECGFELL
jgi:hypothetical protein